MTSGGDELAQARETIRRLNRRCQEAESAAKQKLETVRAGLLEDAGGRPDRRTLGRMLANYAATRLREALEALVKAIDTGTGLDEAMAEARSWLKNYE